MKKTLASKWMIDVALFAGFLTAFFLDLTGLALHQWLGVAAGALAAYHLIAHWDWVSAVSGRFFRKTSGQARLYYLVDAGMLAGFVTIGLTGLAMSSWLNLSLARYDLWLAVHIQASIATLIVTVIKIGLHGRWLVETTRKLLARLGGQARRESPALRPVPAAVPAAAGRQIGRRDFMKMIGIVGVTSAVALGSAASGLRDAMAGQSSGVQVSEDRAASSAQTGSTGAVEASSSAQLGSAQCPRGCSYPGHCRRYTDSNGNGRCDWGESA